MNPDEFYVYKPALAAGRPAVLKRGLGEKALQMTYTDSEELGRTVGFVPVPSELRARFGFDDAQVEQLARYAVAIEAHYGRPMDIEWGLDGTDGRLCIRQAHPETVLSRRTGGTVSRCLSPMFRAAFDLQCEALRRARTTMCLAPQHGIRVADFPLVDADFDRRALPAPVAPHTGKCLGLTSQPLRLSQVRQEGRPSTVYSSLSQCSWELRNAEELYTLNDIPHVNSASMSVEEISATILQRMELDEAGAERAGGHR